MADTMCDKYGHRYNTATNHCVYCGQAKTERPVIKHTDREVANDELD